MDKKIWYNSVSLRGNIITALGLIVKWTGLPVIASEVEAGVSAVFIIIGVVMAVYGRIYTKGENIGWAK